MNVVPTEFVRVMPDGLRRFVSQVFAAVGVPKDQADLLADLLVATDLRGVFSHGTRQTVGYARLLREGKLNPRPQVRVVKEDSSTAVLDGDGGLGHFASWRAAHMAVEKAKAVGLGAVTTRNHNHFGAAGKYSRVASDAGYVGLALSACYHPLRPDQTVLCAGMGSPMSFAFPGGSGPPMVLDMGTGFQPWSTEDFEEAFRQTPAGFFKGLGLGVVCQLLAGVMAGVWELEAEGRPWPMVNQGSFILAIDISRFTPVEDFRAAMDAFTARASQMTPAPGYDRADLPGALEWERERQWSVEGIPVGPEHQQNLETAGSEAGVATPF